MTTDRDSRLFAVMEELLIAAGDGREADVEAAARAHPDLAVEIRELYATAMVAEEFSSLVDDVHDPQLARDRVTQPEANDDGPPLGTVGDYDLLEEIGRGGMGIVFRARQRSLDRIVAVKMLLHGELASDTNVDRFRSEAEAAAQLRHPHIVPVHEVGEHEGRPFFSMDYVEGTTLARRLADGPLPPRRSATWLAEVCDAIDAAHRQGVLHRDLKPSNVLIDPAGRAFVTDFGLAKRIEPSQKPGFSEEAGLLNATLPPALTETGAILGTPGYMAPEQAAGNRGAVGPATDVHALGAVLYACLVGHAPYVAANPLDAVLAVLEQEPLPPRALNRSADADLEMIALKALQKPIDLRYTDVAAMGDDLRAYLAGEPIAARSSRFTDVVVRWFRETHHAAVLENWGVLWMWHSLVLLVICVTTNAMQWNGVTNRWLYVGFWGLGFSTWAAFFWNLRRRAGPVTFVERQIAHVWAGSVACSVLLYWVEGILGLPVLALSPVLGLLSGAVFLVKAGILTGRFYVQSAALFATGLVMAAMQAANPQHNLALSLFGVVSALCFLVPGWEYDRRIRRRD